MYIRNHFLKSTTCQHTVHNTCTKIQNLKTDSTSFEKNLYWNLFRFNWLPGPCTHIQAVWLTFNISSTQKNMSLQPPLCVRNVSLQPPLCVPNLSQQLPLCVTVNISLSQMNLSLQIPLCVTVNVSSSQMNLSLQAPLCVTINQHQFISDASVTAVFLQHTDNFTC